MNDTTASPENEVQALIPVSIPGASMPVQAIEINSKAHAAFRPMTEYFGLDYSGQLAKLRRKSWACVEKVSMQLHRDSQRREVIVIDRRTTGMWLATLDENRVAEDKREELRIWQAEAADALEAHFSRRTACSCDSSLVVVWTHDEVIAQLRQRFGLHYTVNELTRAYRDAGVWKQNGTPRAEFEMWFWHTGSSYCLHAYMLPRLAHRLTAKRNQIAATQARLPLISGIEVPDPASLSD
ncbi:phage antirepressor N-terminal domain-containing protein [Rhodococcus qingshengii]|uniref:phage antirepressor N-terminal domain-containing protein n=1 Tax=Rhodococcus qingshengii TaxID=334542 RepID=UPI0037C76C16